MKYFFNLIISTIYQSIVITVRQRAGTQGITVYDFNKGVSTMERAYAICTREEQKLPRDSPKQEFKDIFMENFEVFEKFHPFST